MIDEKEQVIIVDENDVETGLAPKLEAHEQGLLHRALSVFIRDAHGHFLLQKRNINKYHSGGLWTNSCCSHPRAGESVSDAAGRRLLEEMGITCPLTHLFSTHYKADVGKGMTENELVHVFGGQYLGAVAPDPQEVEGYIWIGLEELKRQLEAEPDQYTIWLRHYLTNYAPTLEKFSA